jgi:uncharacterized protein YeaO (DUF488 family)
MLRTKSVWSPIKPEDGLRILATRFHGRGLPKTRYDVWMASLGPSESLLRSVQREMRTWAGFAREYRRELLLDGPVDELCRTIKNHGQKFTLRLIKELASKGNVTLLCHCSEDEVECHRHLLRKIILSRSV